MPDVTASYGTSFDFVAFFKSFHYIDFINDVWSVVSSSNFCRLCVQLIINTHILLYQYARCDWFGSVFCEFSHLINSFSCLMCCIFTKLSQTVCLIDTYNLIYRYARCNYILWKVIWFICVCLEILKYYYIIEML